MQATAKREMRILDATGDTKLIWDPENADEVAAAKAQFDTLTKKGFKAFSVGAKGKQDELVTAFEADAEKLILIPPVKGG